MLQIGLANLLICGGGMRLAKGAREVRLGTGLERCLESKRLGRVKGCGGDV